MLSSDKLIVCYHPPEAMAVSSYHERKVVACGHRNELEYNSIPALLIPHTLLSLFEVGKW